MTARRPDTRQMSAIRNGLAVLRGDQSGATDDQVHALFRSLSPADRDKVLEAGQPEPTPPPAKSGKAKPGKTKPDADAGA
jgi:hypothetical protein